jgi:hypothetical protein
MGVTAKLVAVAVGALVLTVAAIGANAVLNSPATAPNPRTQWDQLVLSGKPLPFTTCRFRFTGDFVIERNGIPLHGTWTYSEVIAGDKFLSLGAYKNDKNNDPRTSMKMTREESASDGQTNWWRTAEPSDQNLSIDHGKNPQRGPNTPWGQFEGEMPWKAAWFAKDAAVTIKSMEYATIRDSRCIHVVVINKQDQRFDRWYDVDRGGWPVLMQMYGADGKLLAQQWIDSFKKLSVNGTDVYLPISMASTNYSVTGRPFDYSVRKVDPDSLRINEPVDDVVFALQPEPADRVVETLDSGAYKITAPGKPPAVVNLRNANEPTAKSPAVAAAPPKPQIIRPRSPVPSVLSFDDPPVRATPGFWVVISGIVFVTLGATLMLWSRRSRI